MCQSSPFAVHPIEKLYHTYILRICGIFKRVLIHTYTLCILTHCHKAPPKPTQHNKPVARLVFLYDYCIHYATTKYMYLLDRATNESNIKYIYINYI